jgi:hypothetical protein
MRRSSSNSAARRRCLPRASRDGRVAERAITPVPDRTNRLTAEPSSGSIRNAIGTPIGLPCETAPPLAYPSSLRRTRNRPFVPIIPVNRAPCDKMAFFVTRRIIPAGVRHHRNRHLPTGLNTYQKRDALPQQRCCGRASGGDVGNSSKSGPWVEFVSDRPAANFPLRLKSTAADRHLCDPSLDRGCDR